MVLRGLATAVPEHWIGQDDAAAIAASFQLASAKTAGAVRVLYRRAGVHSRHSVVLDSSTNGTAARQAFYPPARSELDRGPALSQRMQIYEQASRELALAVSRRALEAAPADPQQITHLITVSCTGFAAPGFDLDLCAGLPLAPHVARTHIGFMGCHAVLNALRVAHALTTADATAKVLICAVELCSLHQRYGSQPAGIVSNALFGDGAAALVCVASPSDACTDWQLLANGSLIIPGTADQMSWKVGDHGFEMLLSPRVPAVIRGHLRDWLETWLERQGVCLHEVRHWIVHPGGPRILDAVAQGLELHDDALHDSREVLRRYGNMSSPTVIFALERIGTLAGSGPCVMLGFGPGLTVEAALLA